MMLALYLQTQYQVSVLPSIYEVVRKQLLEKETSLLTKVIGEKVFRFLAIDA